MTALVKPIEMPKGAMKTSAYTTMVLGRDCLSTMLSPRLTDG